MSEAIIVALLSLLGSLGDTLGGSVVFDGNPPNQRYYVHRSDLSWFETTTDWSAIYGEGKIVAAADYIEYLQSIGIDTTDFEGE